jgi:hypothetical protein
MSSMLIVVTVAALALAVVMTGIALKLLADERRRSAARVALLAGMAADADVQAHPTASIDLELRHISREAPSGELFAAVRQPSVWPGRLGVAAGLTVSVFTVGAALHFATSVETTSPAPLGAAEPVPASVSVSSTSSTSSTSMLDLLSLRHAEETGVLTITGLVQNPRQGAALSGIVATALLFGADGAFLASGRAPLDFTLLQPGGETGFVIRVPVPGPVARYRVGFRGEDGRIIGHVDRRSAGAIARGPS